MSFLERRIVMVEYLGNAYAVEIEPFYSGGGGGSGPPSNNICWFVLGWG